MQGVRALGEPLLSPVLSALLYSCVQHRAWSKAQPDPADVNSAALGMNPAGQVQTETWGNPYTRRSCTQQNLACSFLCESHHHLPLWLQPVPAWSSSW